MIILHDAMFGIAEIIIFQITKRIAITEKSMKSVLGDAKNMIRFSYLAIPARHEVTCEPYL